MADAAIALMTVQEFLEWQRDQEERYELVDGVPVMMTGASTRHDLVLGNVFASLHGQLSGTPCRPATADIGIRTRIRGMRRADVLVTCDPPSGERFDADDVKMVVEVISPSNTGLRWHRKLEEYRNRPGLIHILLVESELPASTLLSRAGATWSSEDWDGLEGVIELPGIGCRLSMAEVYAGLGSDNRAT